jgi:pyruvate dehydrogenase E1 component alpha subunit
VWGRSLQGYDEVGIVAVGDGGASKGDVHAGMNFAGVYDIPVVFVVLNNQWAISTPVDQQTAAESFAQRARGYGFEGVRVDGNDVLATYEATRRAVERARDHGKPTLVEALTYRRGAHSSSDDDARYRDDAALESWRARDPIDRYERVLADRGLWDPDYGEAVRDAAETRAREAADAALGIAAEQTPEELFDEVFANPPAYIDDQRTELLALYEEHGEEAFRW